MRRTKLRLWPQAEFASTLLSLPDDLIRSVLEQCSLATLVSAALACRRLKMLAYSCSFWDRLNRKRLAPKISLCKGGRAMHFDASDALTLMLSTSRLRNLTRLDLTDLHVASASVLDQVLCTSPALSQLTVSVEWPMCEAEPGWTDCASLCSSLRQHGSRLELLDLTCFDMPVALADASGISKLVADGCPMLRHCALALYMEGHWPCYDALLHSFESCLHLHTLELTLCDVGCGAHGASPCEATERLLDAFCDRQLETLSLLSVADPETAHQLERVRWSRAPASLRSLRLGYLSAPPLDELGALCAASKLRQLTVGVPYNCHEPSTTPRYGELTTDEKHRFDLDLDAMRATYPHVSIRWDVPF